MNTKYTKNIEDIVDYNCNKIDINREVTVNLRDLLYVSNTLHEFNRFFHQPSHYKKIDDVFDFLGTLHGKRGYDILHKSIYNKMDKMIPDDIHEKYSEGEFDCPILPFYYKDVKN